MCAVASPESSLHAVAPSLLGFTGKQIAASQVVREGGRREELGLNPRKAQLH